MTSQLHPLPPRPQRYAAGLGASTLTDDAPTSTTRSGHANDVFSLAADVNWVDNAAVRSRFLNDPLWQGPTNPSLLVLARRAITAFKPREVEDEYRRFSTAAAAKISHVFAFFGLAIGQVYTKIYLDFPDESLPKSDQATYQAVRDWAVAVCLLVLLVGGCCTLGLMIFDVYNRYCHSSKRKRPSRKSGAAASNNTAPSVPPRRRVHDAVQACVPYLWGVAGIAQLVFLAAAHGVCFPEAPAHSSIAQDAACERSFPVMHATILGFAIFFIESPIGAGITCFIMLVAEIILNAVVFPRFSGLNVALRVLMGLWFTVFLLVMSMMRAVTNRSQFRDLVRCHVARVEELAARARAASLVSSVLPRSLVRRTAQVLDEPPVVWDIQECATVCVTEAADFDTFCGTLRDVQAFCAVHHLFTLFDKAAGVFGVECATTLGDAFVCTAGLVSRSSGAGHALRFALWQLRLPETDTLPLRSVIVTGHLEGGIGGAASHAQQQRSASSLRYVIGGPALDRALTIIKHAAADELLLCHDSVRELQAMDHDVLQPPFAIISQSTVPHFMRIQSLQQPDASRSSTMYEDDMDVEEEDLAVIAATRAEVPVFESSELSVTFPKAIKSKYDIGLAAFTDPETEAQYRKTAGVVATKLQGIGMALYLFMMTCNLGVVTVEGTYTYFLLPKTLAVLAIPFLAVAVGIVVYVVNRVRYPKLLPFHISAASIYSATIAGVAYMLVCDWNSIIRNDPIYMVETGSLLLTTFVFPTLPWHVTFAACLATLVAPFSYILVTESQSYGTTVACIIGVLVVVCDINHRCRRTFAAIRYAELGQRAAAEATTRLRELADGIVPRHVIQRGLARLQNHPTANSPAARLQLLQSTCAQKWFMDVVDCFDEFIVASVSIVPSDLSQPHDLRHLWTIVGRALQGYGRGHNVIRLINALGDQFVVGGPFPEAESDGLVLKASCRTQSGGGSRGQADFDGSWSESGTSQWASAALRLATRAIEADASSGSVCQRTDDGNNGGKAQGERHYKASLPRLHEAAKEIATMLSALTALKGARIVAGVAAEEAVGGLVGDGTMRYKLMGVALRHANALRSAASALTNAHLLRHVAPVAGNHVAVLNKRVTNLLLQAGFDENRVFPLSQPWAVRGMPFRRHFLLSLTGLEKSLNSSNSSKSSKFDSAWKEHPSTSSIHRSPPSTRDDASFPLPDRDEMSNLQPDQHSGRSLSFDAAESPFD